MYFLYFEIYLKKKFRAFWKNIRANYFVSPSYFDHEFNIFCRIFKEFVFRSFDIRAFLSIVQINIIFILDNFHNFNKYQKLYIWFWNLTNLLMCKNSCSQFHNQIIKKFLPIQKWYVFFFILITRSRILYMFWNNHIILSRIRARIFKFSKNSYMKFKFFDSDEFRK